MFYVNYRDDKVSSVVDTKDLVEEYYTNAQIEEFRKAGITILTQEDQMGMFEIAKYYLRLIDSIKSKDKKVISDIVTYAEGHINMEDAMHLSEVEDFRAILGFNSVLWQCREVVGDNTISHKDINRELLKNIRRLMNLIREFTEPMNTWGYLSTNECNHFVKKLRRYEESMCQSCKLQFDYLSDWAILSFMIMFPVFDD